MSSICRSRKITLRGIVPDRDIKLLLGPEPGSPDPKELTGEDAHIDDCYAVDLGMPLLIVLSNMAKRHIGTAVITSHGWLEYLPRRMRAGHLPTI